MKYLIFFPIIFLLIGCGDEGDDIVICTVNLSVDCPDSDFDDDVVASGLFCSQGDICGSSEDIDAVVAIEGNLSDLLATAKFRPLASDYREGL